MSSYCKKKFFLKDLEAQPLTAALWTEASVLGARSFKKCVFPIGVFLLSQFIFIIPILW